MRSKFILVLSISLSICFKGFSQLNFTEIQDPDFGQLKVLHFFNDNLGVVAEDSLLHLTHDGGQSWKHRALPMVSGAIGVSVEGNDTLFVIAEGEFHRLWYFHGFHGTPVLLHSWSGQPYNEYPSIAFNGSNVIVAGSYIDTVSGEPGFFKSSDHGSTWNFHTEEDNSTGMNFSSVTQRQADTMIVGRSIYRAPNPLMFGGEGEYWLQNMHYQYAANSRLYTGGTRFTCFENTCISYKREYLNVQSGTPLYSDAHLKDLWEIGHVDYSDVRLIMNAPDEFMTVYADRDEEYKFHVSTYQFKWLGPDIGRNPKTTKILDSITYTFIDSNAIAEVPGGVCRTDNYIYFTLAPKLYRVGLEDISVKDYSLKDVLHFQLGYSTRDENLVFFGLQENEDYLYQVYSANGQQVKSGSLGKQRTLPMPGLTQGVYLIWLESADGTYAVNKFVKS